MFHDMHDGTAEDWAVIGAAHAQHQREVMPLKIIDTLRSMKAMTLGFAADQLSHQLIAGTLARRAGATDEQVVAALCHDIGKVLSVPNHGPIAAEMMKPYVSDEVYHTIYYHQHFQGAYYYNFAGMPTDMRLKFKDEPWFGFACKLVDEWDAPAFDPDFAVDSLESFEPEITRVFSAPKRMIV